MRTRELIVLLVIFLSVSLGARGQEQWVTRPNGLQYKILTANAGDKIKVNDIITFNFIQKTDKDSVLGSSYQVGRPVKIQVQQSRSITDLMEFFTQLTARDSAIAKIPADSIFKNDESQRPAFLPKGSSLVFLIKIEKVQSLDEVMAEEKLEMEKLQAAEKQALDKYIADQKQNVKSTPSGLRYVIIKASAKNKPLSSDTVYVNYTGRTLEGKVFDSSIEAEAKKAGLNQPGRTYEPIHFAVGEGEVIKGWDEGLLLLNEGSKARFFIPSQLAYGSQGAGEDIKPFSPLIFDVELVKIKPAKRAKPPVVSPAAKTPAKVSPKKKPAGTPVKKPTPVKK
ncbi:FKBP-type peptidyl-prolyl cis-trans isomerase [Rubrolithibacter danxiaensis]|uniref:FKBP-type peptidyl-prolyl cis-trans isomerase n=1 Tax=Rubrolithibacter danxiaensis TaxID=3390805 RepID=UPI003BF7AF86